MNVRRLAPPLLIALGVSGLCTYGLSRKLSKPSVQQLAVLHYMAPLRPLEAGEVLRPDMLQPVTWPAANPIPGAFFKAADLAGRTLLYPIATNQPLTEKMISAPGAGAGLAGHIPEGMRAIALKSDEIMGVAGFLLPGSHLDVLVTYRTDKIPDPRTVTVLQNAQVLAAGQQMQPDPQGKPATVDVVTLLLSPADAERAVLASTQGTIHFVLRGGSDGGRTNDGGIQLSQLGDPNAILAPTPASAPTPKAVRATRPALPAIPKPVRQSIVQTISGDKQVTATFDEAGK